MGYKDSLPANYQPTEQMLYFGQALTNKYVHSKFLAQRDTQKASRLTSLMAYAHGAGERERVLLNMSREYTLQVLYRLGLAWPVTSWDYLRRLISVLNGLRYFDEAAQRSLTIELCLLLSASRWG